MASGLQDEPGIARTAVEPGRTPQEARAAGAAIGPRSLAAAGPADRPLWRQAWAAWSGRGEPFGRCEIDGWRCVFLRRLEKPPAWSRLDGVEISGDDWQHWLREVLAGLNGQWPALKSDRSGTVAGGTLTSGSGRLIEVIAKRPLRTRWWQGGMDLIRPGRVRRTWLKTWALQTRGIATEIPLLLAERRAGIAVRENVLVVERVAGVSLRALALDELKPGQRHALLGDLGATLAAIDAMWWCHLDAKAHNWMVHKSGGDARAVMIDCDGVRMYPVPGAGLRRLLAALSRQEGFTTADARAVCNGYAPAGWPGHVRRAFAALSVGNRA